MNTAQSYCIPLSQANPLADRITLARLRDATERNLNTLDSLWGADITEAVIAQHLTDLIELQGETSTQPEALLAMYSLLTDSVKLANALRQLYANQPALI